MVPRSGFKESHHYNVAETTQSPVNTRVFAKKGIPQYLEEVNRRPAGRRLTIRLGSDNLIIFQSSHPRCGVLPVKRNTGN
jgi:hypothetical protein